MLKSLSLSRSLFAKRSFTTLSVRHADKANGGFGEEIRQEQGKEPVKDTA